MPASCPECGSRILNVSKSRSWKERLDIFGFTRHLRCRDCKTKFVARTFEWGDLLFARCPQCRMMDLNHWLGEHFRARGWMAFKIAFGGHRYRCEYCRINFASLRRRKEHFTFKRWSQKKETNEHTRTGH